MVQWYFKGYLQSGIHISAFSMILRDDLSSIFQFHFSQNWGVFLIFFKLQKKLGSPATPGIAYQVVGNIQFIFSNVHIIKKPKKL